MKNKYSPGPWRGGNMIEHTPSIYDANNMPVCQVNGISNGGRGHSNTEEGKANKRLIAAAPDLLEQCEIALRLMREYAPYLKHSGMERAIKKAGGSI